MADRVHACDQEQRRIDEIVHYRNLAIAFGAPPEQMLNAFDRDLCERGLADSVEFLREAPDIWEENERLVYMVNEYNLSNLISQERLVHREWATRRMLQSLDAYWQHSDGAPRKGHVCRLRCDNADERWWNRFERYRRELTEQ